MVEVEQGSRGSREEKASIGKGGHTEGHLRLTCDYKYMQRENDTESE